MIDTGGPHPVETSAYWVMINKKKQLNVMIIISSKQTRVWREHYPVNVTSSPEGAVKTSLDFWTWTTPMNYTSLEALHFTGLLIVVTCIELVLISCSI